MDDDVTVYADGCMLVKGDRAPKFYVDNTAETLDADDYVQTSWETHGFDTVEISDHDGVITHPYKRLYEGDKIWTYIKGLADASVPLYAGFDRNGTFRFRAVLATGFTDPIAVEVLEDTKVLKPLGTNLMLRQANKIVGHGVKINSDVTQPAEKLWDARYTGLFTKYGGTYPSVPYMNEEVAAAAVWPPKATYGDFWADLDLGEAEEGLERYITYKVTEMVYVENQNEMQSGGRHRLGYFKSVTKEISTGKKYRLLGMDNVRMAVQYHPTTLAAPTQTVLDTTTKPGAARILLTNGAASSIYLTGVHIIGTPVMMMYGSNGWIHDKFEDVEDIEQYGEKKFSFGNEDVVNKSQVEDMADYYWKYNKGQKHAYRINYPGEAHFFRPGDWVWIDIGAVGQPEYILSVAEIFEVNIERSQHGAARTELVCIEVEEAWKKDSSAIARLRAASSLWNRSGDSGVLKIAASNSQGADADVYCDGTADEVEINLAIAVLSLIGGGIVHLGPGTFVTAAAIEMKSNVTLEGEGPNATIIEKNCNDYAIEAVGGSGTELTNIGIKNLSVTKNAADSNTKDLIYFLYADECILQDLKVYDSGRNCFEISNCNDIKISNIKIIDFEYCGMYVGGGVNAKVTDVDIDCSGVTQGVIPLSGSNIGAGVSFVQDGLTVNGLTIKNITTNSNSSYLYGIRITGEGTGALSLSNIIIDNLTHTDTNYTVYGIETAADHTQFANVQINDVDNSTTAANSFGIFVINDDCTFSNIFVTGCTGTGMEIDTTADKTVCSSGRITGNTTDQFDDNGSNTSTAAWVIT